MDYSELFSESHIATLHDWLVETGELYAHLEFPHSGGSGTPYFVRTERKVKELTARQSHPEIEIFIYRHLQYPIRGIADDTLLNAALEAVSDGVWYSIVSLDDYYPKPCNFLGSGDCHAELVAEFDQVRGKAVGIGVNPMDVEKGDLEWVYTHADQVMYLAVTKNRNFSFEYAKDPKRYESVIRAWREG
jgi:hypothetical protein